MQDYKDALGSQYPYVFAWDGGDDDKPAEKCEMPVIAYADGTLRFSSSTAGAEYHYTITAPDAANDKLTQNGEVSLAASYTIAAYATAEGYRSSDVATATLYWINANLQTDPSSGIVQAQARGIIACSDGGIVTVSGLNDGETVSFFTADGRLLGASKAYGGTASCAASAPFVIAKVGSSSIKIPVK